MKKNLRKLALNRETLKRLEPNAEPQVAGGLTNGTTCTDTNLESCGGSCATRCSACCCV